MKSPVRLMTMPELAERLRISKRSGYRIARELVHAVIAGRLLVTEESLESYIASKLREPECFDASSKGRSPPSQRSNAAAIQTASWLKPIVPRTKPRPQ
jgi:hypothetical protein